MSLKMDGVSSDFQMLEPILDKALIARCRWFRHPKDA